MIIKLSFEEWEKKFKPRIVDTALLQILTTTTIIQGIKEKKIWAVTEDDEGTFIQNGWHKVNVLYHTMCDVPYPDDVTYIVDYR